MTDLYDPEKIQRALHAKQMSDWMAGPPPPPMPLWAQKLAAGPPRLSDEELEARMRKGAWRGKANLMIAEAGGAELFASRAGLSLPRLRDLLAGRDGIAPATPGEVRRIAVHLRVPVAHLVAEEDPYNA